MGGSGNKDSYYSYKKHRDLSCAVFLYDQCQPSKYITTAVLTPTAEPHLLKAVPTYLYKLQLMAYSLTSRQNSCSRLWTVANEPDTASLV